MGWKYDINLDNIDWELLIKQKNTLDSICRKLDENNFVTRGELDDLEKILILLNHIDDKIDAGDYRQTYEK
jgi:hypothetical protein